MNTNRLLHGSQRWLLTLVVAAVLALAATYTPVVLDATAGTNLTNTAFACGAPSGGC